MDRQPRRVLVACDKFKGSLSATEVIDAIREGLEDGAPGVVVDSVVVADGGDGTLQAALYAGFDRLPVTVAGPTGEPVRSALGVLDHGPADRTVVVEMADLCGLGRLPGGVRAPLTASSRGLGEGLARALDLGPSRIILGIGGSASTDGGAGMLAALGAHLRGADGRDLPDGGGALVDLAEVDLSGLHAAVGRTEIVLACDVSSPLLGPHGAAAVFGPQKGATPEDVDLLDRGLTRWATLVTAATGLDRAAAPGAGAAGGVGYAALAVLGAVMRPGIELVLDLVDMEHHLTQPSPADLVVTGEGSLDAQTLTGKAPAGVAHAAGAHGIPVIAVCGRTELDAATAADHGIAAVYALSDLEPDAATSMREARSLLRRTAARAGRDLVSGRFTADGSPART